MIEFPRDAQQVLAAALGATVKVLGIGGAGCNIVDRMAMDGMDAAETLTLNTDARALLNGVTADRLQLGAKLTRGLGAGGDPEIGSASAIESANEIRAAVVNRKLIFLCAGLGGGTGSGSAPEVARIAREAGAMVITFATMPFTFEGKRRLSQAAEALDALRRHSDAVIVFENDRMGEVVLATDGVQKAFEAADRLVGRSVRAVAAIITKPGMIRLGLDDLLAVLRPSSGYCLFGHGHADGENRAKEAMERALKSPLLNRGRLLKGASGVLVHVTGGEDLRLFEVQTLMRELGRHVDERAQIFFGMAVDPAMKKGLTVTVFSPLSPEDSADSTETPAVFDRAPEPIPVFSPAEEAPVIYHQSSQAIIEPTAQLESYAEPEPQSVLPSPFDSEVVPVATPEYQEVVSASPEEAEMPAPVRPELETRHVTVKAPQQPVESSEDPAPESGKSTQIRLGQPLRPPTRGLDEIVPPVDSAGQRELQLGARNDGGRFDKSEPTVIDGEDLDLPAYTRKFRK
ncbi:MAG: cell division protein FtsZ [Verrucomicrobiales bacterium]